MSLPVTAWRSPIAVFSKGGRDGQQSGRPRWIVAALVCLMLLPAAAHAQSAIAGVVKDATGAVIPGVTVEAASPELIEKVRSVDDR